MSSDNSTDSDRLFECAGGLTIKDPWAQAIIHGPKRIENRTWKPPSKVIGERIAVGVSQSRDSEIEAALEKSHIHWSHTEEWIAPDGWGDYRWELERHHPGHIIGTVRVVGAIDGSADPASERAENFVVEGDAVECPIEDDPWYQRDASAWWLLDDPQPLDEPVPVRGMPGVWDVEQQVEKAREATNAD